jgi:hypothetical protein
MNLEKELETARVSFDQHASGGTIASADLEKILAAIGQPHELAGANEVIDYVKRTSFTAAPEGRVSWSELETWLRSDGRDRR